MAELHLAWALSCPGREQFAASVRYRRLGDMTLAEFRGGQYRGDRSTATRCDDRAMIGVLLNRSGRLVCRYAGEDLVLEADQMLIWDSELAYSFDGVEPHHELSIMLPRARVPEALGAIAAHNSAVIPVKPGSGVVAVAADQLKAITREMAAMSDAGLQITCRGFFDTLDAALATPGEQVMTSPRAALLAKVRRFIEDNLDDPGLHASSIAAAHAISVRTLHLLFAETGTTVTRLIRRRRIEWCYRDLSRARPGTTVTDVAMRWGFSDTAHFSRLFKQAYGVTPSSVIPRRQPVASQRPHMGGVTGPSTRSRTVRQGYSR